jgi:hypothetical protein
MTPEDAKKILEEIERGIIDVYEQRLFGEEIFNYVILTQKKVEQLKEYIDTHTILTP